MIKGKKLTYKLATKDPNEQKQVTGTAYGSFGVHKDDIYFVTTHIKTGLCLIQSTKRFISVFLAREGHKAEIGDTEDQLTNRLFQDYMRRQEYQYKDNLKTFEQWKIMCPESVNMVKEDLKEKEVIEEKKNCHTCEFMSQENSEECTDCNCCSNWILSNEIVKSRMLEQEKIEREKITEENHELEDSFDVLENQKEFNESLDKVMGYIDDTYKAEDHLTDYLTENQNNIPSGFFSVVLENAPLDELTDIIEKIDKDSDFLKEWLVEGNGSCDVIDYFFENVDIDYLVNSIVNMDSGRIEQFNQAYTDDEPMNFMLDSGVSIDLVKNLVEDYEKYRYVDAPPPKYKDISHLVRAVS